MICRKDKRIVVSIDLECFEILWNRNPGNFFYFCEIDEWRVEAFWSLDDC